MGSLIQSLSVHERPVALQGTPARRHATLGHGRAGDPPTSQTRRQPRRVDSHPGAPFASSAVPPDDPMRTAPDVPRRRLAAPPEARRLWLALGTPSSRSERPSNPPLALSAVCPP